MVWNLQFSSTSSEFHDTIKLQEGIWSIQRDERSVVRKVSGCEVAFGNCFLCFHGLKSLSCSLQDPSSGMIFSLHSQLSETSTVDGVWRVKPWFGAWLKSCVSLQRVTTSGGGRVVSLWMITRARVAAWSTRQWPWPLQGLLSPSSPGPAVSYSLLRYKSLSPHFLTLSLCQPANTQQVLWGPTSVCSWVSRGATRGQTMFACCCVCIRGA